MPVLEAKASAANLHGFGTAVWMRGLLDPKQVAGPGYFGNTAHKEGDMVNFVQNDLADAAKWKPDDIEAVVAAMAEEATAASHSLAQKTTELDRLLGTFQLGEAPASGSALQQRRRTRAA